MIKAVAVDMDGTFLDSKGQYDRKRFENVFQVMQEKGVHFIVASGNQYYQLKSFFPGKEAAITFVSENGAIVIKDQEVLKESHFDPQLVTEILTFLQAESNELEVVVCGLKSAYMLKNSTQRFKDFSALYYFELMELDSFDELPEDDIVKFALDVPIAQTEKVVDDLNQAFKGKITAVSSGQGSIDIIIPGVTKGSAIQWLLDGWALEADQLAAFGDANNDLEMLALTKYSYAMKESSPAVKETAKNQAPSNDDAGVLQIVEELIH